MAAIPKWRNHARANPGHCVGRQRTSPPPLTSFLSSSLQLPQRRRKGEGPVVTEPNFTLQRRRRGQVFQSDATSEVTDFAGLLFLLLLLHSPHWPLAVAGKQSPNKLPKPRKFHLTLQPSTSMISQNFTPFSPFLSTIPLAFLPLATSSLKVFTPAIPFAWNVLCFHPSPVILYIIAKMSLPQGSFFCVLHR